MKEWKHTGKRREGLGTITAVIDSCNSASSALPVETNVPCNYMTKRVQVLENWSKNGPFEESINYSFCAVKQELHP